MIQSDIVHQRQKISFFLSYVCEYYVDSKCVYFLCSPTYYGLLPKREPWISNKIETRANESKRADASCLKGWNKIWIKEKIGTGDQFKWLRNISLTHGKRFKVTSFREERFSTLFANKDFLQLYICQRVVIFWIEQVRSSINSV